MFLDPRVAIDNEWIRGIKNPEKQLQPNAIDFTLDHVFSVTTNEFMIYEDPETHQDVKQMRGVNVELIPVQSRHSPISFFNLQGNTIYDGQSDVYVKLPDGVAALLIQRSVFSRNGMFLTSGLYDSGFEGHISFMIHNRSSRGARVQPGIRFGQVIFVEANNAGLYKGQWSHKEGTHWTDKSYGGTN